MKEIKMKWEELPFYTRMTYPLKTKNGKTFKLGEVKRQFLYNKYACPKEKQCANHFVTVLGTVYENSRNLVCRDDGTSWILDFGAFEKIERVDLDD